MNLKNRLAATGASQAYFPDTRFGAPGMLRGPTIARAPEDDSGGGGAGDDDDQDDSSKQIDPAAHAALASAHDRLKRDAKADRDAIKAMRAELDEAKRVREEADHEAAHKSGDVEKVKTQLEAKHGAVVVALTERAEKAEAQVRRLVIEGNLSVSLDDVHIKPDLKRAATAMLLREGVELEDDDDGNPVAVKGGLPLAEAIKLWAESPEGKAFVLDGNSGGGVPPGGKHSARNPWKAETRNLAEQDAIEAKNPTLAGRLKAEAGV